MEYMRVSMEAGLPCARAQEQRVSISSSVVPGA